MKKWTVSHAQSMVVSICRLLLTAPNNRKANTEITPSPPLARPRVACPVYRPCINPCKNTRNDSWSCCSLIGHKITKVLWHQSKAGATRSVWNWFGKTVSSGAPLFVLEFLSQIIFSPVPTFLAPTNCP